MEILNNFGIQPTLLFAQIVNFVIILYLLKRFFYKPILKILDERRKKIEESLKNADLISEKLQKTDENSKKIIADSQIQAQNLIQDARREAERIGEKASLEARKTIDQALVDAKIQIEAERESIQKKIERETLDLVVAVVKKVLKRNLKPQEKQALTGSAVREITKQIQ